MYLGFMNQKQKLHVSISIVIPVYNEENHLRLCLDAIAGQISKATEVIVVDNNSTDGSVALAKQYSFVTVLEERKQGIVFARNRGFDAAKGDVIARIDADTVLPPHWLARVADFFADPQHAHSVLTGGCYFYNLHSGTLTGRMYDLVVHRTNRLLLGHYFPWGSNSALPRPAWRKVRNEVCLRTDIHEDLDLGIHLERAGYHVSYRSSMRVGARAKRIVTDRGDLWRYLAMWPRTLRVHGARKWSLIWPLAIGVWLGRYGILITEHIAEPFARKRH